MSVVTITRTPFGGSPEDITGNVILASASFDSQLAAAPGSFEFTCKDLDQTLGFVTGDEISLTIDGTKMYGGYITQVSRTFAFEADDTSSPSTFPNRYFVVRGVDYNILFDKRFARNTANYKAHLPFFNKNTKDGTALKFFLANYIDLPAGFDATTHIDDIRTIPSADVDVSYVQQGDSMRTQFQDFAQFSGAIYYIDANRNIHWHSIESVESRWGFSDVPNHGTITGSTGFQNAFYGFREMEAVEDGSVIVNDVLMWGGKAFTSDGNVVFDREQDTTSESTHGRWQLAEVHFNEDGYGLQEGVNARARAIVFGESGSDTFGFDSDRGLRYPQWNMNIGWFGKDVPLLSGSPKHIQASDLVTFSLEVFGTGGTPLILTLPTRSIRISFPTGKADGSTEVRFDGVFGLQLDDPKTIWAYLLGSKKRIESIVIGTTTNGSTSTTYGANGAFTPSPAPDGTNKTFSIPFGYIPGTLRISVNGLEQRLGIDFSETSSDAGLFTMSTAPYVTDTLYALCKTLSS